MKTVSSRRLVPCSWLFALAAAASTACTTEVAQVEDLESDEQAVSAARCLFGSTRETLEASSALEVGASRTVKLSAALSPDDRRQLARLGNGDPQAFLRSTDDDEVTVRTVTEKVSGRTFTWVAWHAGDNPQGHLFVGNSTATAAVLGDDSIYSCNVTAQPSPSSFATCAFGSNVTELDRGPGFTRSAFRTLTASTSVSAIRREQLRAIDAYANDGPRGVFSWVDGGRISVRTLTQTSSRRRFTEYRALRGGAPVHRIFGEGTLDLTLSSIEGGEIANCTVGNAAACSPSLTERAETPALRIEEDQAYSDCRYCTGLDLREWAADCSLTSDLDTANRLGLAFGQDAGNYEFVRPRTLSRADFERTMSASNLGRLARFVDASVGPQARYLTVAGQYQPTAPNVDGREDLVVIYSPVTKKVFSIAKRDEYP
jgi:hypothetical protein